MARGRVYQNTASLRPRRSMFDLSYEKKFTCDMGKLIPVMCDEVVPGDIFKIGNQSVIRFQPMVAPIMHSIYAYVHYFFVPYRILWNAKTREDLTETGDWEDFITGGLDGANSDTLPRWEPTTYDEGSLWDYLGFPIDVDPDGAYPIDFPRRAYNLIYNEYYRDENLEQTAVAWTNEDILNRAWEKDYFTSALPWQQRGTAPSLPITGEVSVTGIGVESNSWQSAPITVYETGETSSGTYSSYQSTDLGDELLIQEDPNNTGFPNVRADLSEGATFDVADLRLAFQIQKWMERNARAGARHTEFLRSHFGVAPRDDRLQRPEYIGGTKSPVVISEVLQTSSTDGTSPQGNLAGHGLNVNSGYAGSCRALEYGLIMGIMSVMPRPVYQQGIDRQWLRETRYDFFFPEFANLSEQAIVQAEIFATAVESENTTIFGYQGRYDEMRVKRNQVCGLMRSDATGTLEYWHLARDFASAPTLNSTFIKCVPDKARIFAVADVDGLIVNFANIVKAFRPLPITAEPGLIDHS